MNPLDLVKLSTLMEVTRGRPEILVGLIDGPVARDHPDLAEGNIRVISGESAETCGQDAGPACQHGTFVAGILCARRSSAAPAICPDCSLLVRPIFTQRTAAEGSMPGASPETLAGAILETIEAGARILNLSVALAQTASIARRDLEDAFNYAASRGVIVLAAAGNQGTLGGSPITRHPWVIPVVGYDLQGRPMVDSNLGSSIGRRGLGAPGEGITSLGTEGNSLSLAGTSTATPFVTGAAALLWSEFPAATAAEIKFAMLQGFAPRRTSVLPPLLDAVAAYQLLRNYQGRN